MPRFLFVSGKGATAWELQVGIKNRASIEFRYVHLRGGYWVWWAPWRRIKVIMWGAEHS